MWVLGIRSLRFVFLFGRSTIAGIIRDTCTAIRDTMEGTYMRSPAVEHWISISDQYEGYQTSVIVWEP